MKQSHDRTQIQFDPVVDAENEEFDFSDAPRTGHDELFERAQGHFHEVTDAEDRTRSSARLGSKGQVTIPRAVREALSLEGGDRLIFRVEGDHAILARPTDLVALTGSVSVAAAKRAAPWADVVAETRGARAAKGR